MKPKISPTLSPEYIEVDIDSLSFNGGRGVGRYQGVVVFIPDTAPGDRVRAHVVRRKSRFWEAELHEILKPSSARRTPPCPVASRCGGCSWQHLDYATQVQQKEKILNDSLRGLRKWGAWATLPFLQAEDEFYYRSRVQLHGDGVSFGFFAKRSHALVAIEKCWIAEEAINSGLKGLKVAAGERVELTVGADGRLHILSGMREAQAALFSQVNRAQNEILRKHVLSAVQGQPQWIFDLYSGSGNLAHPLAHAFPTSEIHALELSGAAVELGRKNAPAEVHWYEGDVEKRLKTMSTPTRSPGLVVLDPPRVGASAGALDQILLLKPKQIIYVSCNPTTFARDAAILIENGRFRLASVQGLDMFPQTEHVELIASLCAAT